MKPLDKAYDPKIYETPIYAQWEQSGAFTPDGNLHLQSSSSPKPAFTIIMPPPNANGDLHLGHAMFVIEDIMTRYRRMLGHPTLWLPGTDHAGIETQVVYEKELKKDGLSRFDLGREKFFASALSFTLSNQPKIINQLKSLGFSADWSRQQFTLDKNIVDVIYSTFKKMYADGLIYRGNRIVNWCTSCKSSFADIEVTFVDDMSNMYTLDYGDVQISTTRPETIFADAAVAVHPDDPRYSQLVGKSVTVPLIGKQVPVISDSYVDQAVGTGALKVTPSHDKNDYNIGLRHDLPIISVIDLDGNMINVPDKYLGMNVNEARKAVITDLQTAGKLVNITPLNHSVATHDRCGTIIEPLITDQWYMRVAEPNQAVIEAFETNKIAVSPERFTKIALNWLKNEHDWNISRQNWFGIKIPVFYRTSDDLSKSDYIITNDVNEAIAYYGIGNFREETDVFDTWFSSGQWPYATLMATGDFDKGFYPTSIMETGRDILTKWVTKMAMFGIYTTGNVPFDRVYLHGMINDQHGKKMSKSKGNVINPLDMTSKYGTDALRLALTIGITPGNDGALSEAKIEGYRNFCNKLWNVSRFIISQLPTNYVPATPAINSLADAWIMTQLTDKAQAVSYGINELNFSSAGELCYSLLWDDFADWYLEASKIETNVDMLVYVLEMILSLLHPMAPFVTEAIWSALPWHKHMLITSPWPQLDDVDASIRLNSQKFENIMELVLAVRSAVAEEKISQPIVLTTNSEYNSEFKLIMKLAHVSEIRSVDQGSGIPLSASIQSWIEMNSEQLSLRSARLQAELSEKTKYLTGLNNKLGNETYISKAPESIVQETRDRRDETLMLISKLDEQLKQLRTS